MYTLYIKYFAIEDYRCIGGSKSKAVVEAEAKHYPFSVIDYIKI